jgi:RNA polymerase sigma-70 factor (ECF subfamily)
METSSTGRPAEERRAAFEAVTVPLMKILYSRALNLSRSPDVAGDLVQETYLRAFRTFDNFATILYSLFVNRYRRQQREPESIPLDEADLSGPPAVERRALLDPKLWAGEEVNAALRRLPEQFRVILLMVDVDEMSYEEVAAALQCPLGTVRSRLSRGRKLLYTELIDYARSRGFGKGES